MLPSWLPFIAHLTTTTVPCTRPSCFPVAPDTGTVAAFAPLLLTPELVTSYAAVETALNAYMTAHPYEDSTIHAHGGSVTKQAISLKNGGTMQIQMTDPGYLTLVQHDTALAGIFTRQHFDPARYMPVMITVRGAIGVALSGKTADTATVTGKNLAVVQAHRSVLATDWEFLQNVETMMNKQFEKLMQIQNDQD